MAALSLLGSLAAAEVGIRIVKPGFLGFELPQVEHRPAPGIGFEMVPDQRAHTFAAPATINSLGYRGPEIEARPQPGALRVLCLGDSITFGVGVPDDAPYPRQLERLWNARNADRPCEAINAGVQRYFAYQEIDQLRLRGRELKPHVVTLGLYTNDLGVRPDGDYSAEYEKERERSASAFRKRAPWLYLATKKSALLALLRNAIVMGIGSGREPNMLLGRATAKEERQWSALRDDLATFKKLAGEDRFVPVVVAIPSAELVRGTFPNSLYPRRISEYCEELGLPLIDVEPRFRARLAAGENPFLEWDGHLSAAGHREVAQAIADELARLAKASGGASAP